MKIEISLYDQEFVVKLLNKSRLRSVINNLVATSTVHPDNEDYVECKIAMSALEDLVGELSYEANHNRSKIIAAQACDVAESLEGQLYNEKHSK